MLINKKVWFFVFKLFYGKMKKNKNFIKNTNHIFYSKKSNNIYENVLNLNYLYFSKIHEISYRFSE